MVLKQVQLSVNALTKYMLTTRAFSGESPSRNV
jgi:hypothetical protein